MRFTDGKREFCSRLILRPWALEATTNAQLRLSWVLVAHRSAIDTKVASIVATQAAVGWLRCCQHQTERNSIRTHEGNSFTSSEALQFRPNSGDALLAC